MLEKSKELFFFQRKYEFPKPTLLRWTDVSWSVEATNDENETSGRSFLQDSDVRWIRRLISPIQSHRLAGEEERILILICLIIVFINWDLNL